MTLVFNLADSVGYMCKPTSWQSTTQYPVSLLAILAVDEFVALATNAEREAWAAAHGVTRPITGQLMGRVRGCHRRRADNRRLGLPDPLRGRAR